MSGIVVKCTELTRNEACFATRFWILIGSLDASIQCMKLLKSKIESNFVNASRESPVEDVLALAFEH